MSASVILFNKWVLSTAKFSKFLLPIGRKYIVEQSADNIFAAFRE